MKAIKTLIIVATFYIHFHPFRRTLWKLCEKWFCFGEMTKRKFCREIRCRWHSHFTSILSTLHISFEEMAKRTHWWNFALTSIWCCCIGRGPHFCMQWYKLDVSVNIHNSCIFDAIQTYASQSVPASVWVAVLNALYGRDYCSLSISGVFGGRCFKAFYVYKSVNIYLIFGVFQCSRYFRV